MVKLKSTFGKSSLSKKKRSKGRPIKNIITGGITALVGVAFVSQIANVLRRL